MEGSRTLLPLILAVESALRSGKGKAELLSLVFSLNKEIGLIARTEPSLAIEMRALQAAVNSVTVAIKKGDIGSAISSAREAAALVRGAEG